MTSRQLQCFLQLAATRSFTKAAGASHLSQPAFSAVIRQLEEALEVRLFDRSTRHVALTADGVAFEVSARRVLNEMESAVTGMKDRAARRTGRVAIALLPSLAADWLPPVLAGFHAAYPGIEIEVADVLSEPCIDRVRDGQADFALAATRASTDELSAELFCSDAFHLVCPTGHVLTRVKQPRPRDLAAHPFIHLSRTSSVRQYLDASIHPHVFPSLMEVDQLATVSGMVRAGLGISIVPTLTLYQFRVKGLAIVPLEWPGLKRNIYLVRRRDRGLSVAAQGLCDWVLAARPASDRKRKKA